MGTGCLSSPDGLSRSRWGQTCWLREAGPAVTATQRARTGRRYLGAVYGIDLIDHESFMAGTPKIVPNDYVGKTRQRGRARENQHRDDQRWSDLIVGSSHVLWEGMCTEEELDQVEQRLIRELAPRMNWQHNEHNLEQIPKWVQLEQRHQRDARAGRDPWQPPEERIRSSLLDWTTQAPRRAWRFRLPSRLTTLPQRIGVWCTGWVLLTAFDLAAFNYYRAPWTWTQQLLGAAIGSAVLLTWSLLRPLDSVKLWKRRLRKAYRWLRR